ncbi:uncharacterized protein LOC115058581 isoform X4 [Echeneis naucrates]|uniref:uncharacterized protein LOC115058581 isoform X4 n=1 Tax=Echeneis naucrates TaxID=173247 RepID=UPI0011146CEC|nr:uncharacterized protein LOC115058581 isoform X4 [Echeneis naucrates]
MRFHSLRINSFQDESSQTETSSEKDDSDFMCPDSGLRTLDCMSVTLSLIKVEAPTDVTSLSQQLLGDQNLKKMNLLRDQNLRDQNLDWIVAGSGSLLDWDQ